VGLWGTSSTISPCTSFPAFASHSFSFAVIGAGKRFSNFFETSLHVSRRRVVNKRSGSGRTLYPGGFLPSFRSEGARRAQYRTAGFPVKQTGRGDAKSDHARSCCSSQNAFKTSKWAPRNARKKLVEANQSLLKAVVSTAPGECSVAWPETPVFSLKAASSGRRFHHDTAHCQRREWRAERKQS